MSTLVAQTISNGTVSTSSANVIQGSAKAWVNFNGSGGASIRASFNVSSVTRNGTGDYTVNFTNSLTDSSYSMFGITTGANTSNVTRLVVIKGSDGSGATNKTASAVTIQTGSSAGGTLLDMNEINVGFFR
jgi:hypothetical protein